MMAALTSICHLISAAVNYFLGMNNMVMLEFDLLIVHFLQNIFLISFLRPCLSSLYHPITQCLSYLYIFNQVLSTLSLTITSSSSSMSIMILLSLCLPSLPSFSTHHLLCLSFPYIPTYLSTLASSPPSTSSHPPQPRPSCTHVRTRAT